jgi:hypothetical protein
MTMITNQADDLQGRQEDSALPSTQATEIRNSHKGMSPADAGSGLREVTIVAARHAPSDSRAWQMARSIGLPMSVPNSIYETVVSPSGTVRRKVRRDVVRSAARLAPSEQTAADLKKMSAKLSTD